MELKQARNTKKIDSFPLKRRFELTFEEILLKLQFIYVVTYIKLTDNIPEKHLGK